MQNEPTQGVAASTEISSARRFPSTSAAFDLRPYNSRPSLSQSQNHPSSHDVVTDQHISALHSSAFGELHKSITDASENFVQRMRDWESTRPQASRLNNRLSSPFPAFIPSRGCESFPRISNTFQAASEDYEPDGDNDDDVLILSDETSSVNRASPLCSPGPPKKRARSLGDMDLDSPEMIPTIPPVLSHTVASSSTSSLLSLSPPSVIPASSLEEKAIAALTLALANGAAGLNDYAAVREALGVSAAPADGASEVGEMWW
jgi:hypothetical protein